LVKGLDHPKRMFDLTEGLTRRGYSDTDIKSILGGNAVRVLGEIGPLIVGSHRDRGTPLGRTSLTSAAALQKDSPVIHTVEAPLIVERHLTRMDLLRLWSLLAD
jgi:hypothetical protein